MISIIQAGHARHHIAVDDERIGWIHGRTLGFRGFISEGDARDAVVELFRALDRALHVQHPGWAWRQSVELELKVVDHDGDAWVVHRDTRVARVLRPHRRAFDASLGIEIEVPASIADGQLLQAAIAAARAAAPFRDLKPVRTGEHESPIRDDSARAGP